MHVHMMGGCSRILLAAMSFAAHAAAGEGKLWQQQQRVTSAAPARASRGNSYVFLQKFPLEGTDDLLFHTEILICPSKNFIAEDQQTLDKQIVLLQDFVEIDESWWSTRTANCVELGYGGDSCTERCCSVPHGPEQNSYVLNERRAMIKNAKTDEKQLYLYGAGAMDGNAAFHATCDRKCWSNWKGTDYNPLTNNCNTFTRCARDDGPESKLDPLPLYFPHTPAFSPSSFTLSPQHCASLHIWT